MTQVLYKGSVLLQYSMFTDTAKINNSLKRVE